MRRHSRAGRDWRRRRRRRRQQRACSSTPPHPGPNRDPDIKGRWSETMKLQVRCQLPFETKHSPNPGKTQPVCGIRTNKEELKGELQRREGRRRFYGPCWQSCVGIKGPNSALNYPPVLLGSPVWVCESVLSEKIARETTGLQAKTSIDTLVSYSRRLSPRTQEERQQSVVALSHIYP